MLPPRDPSTPPFRIPVRAPPAARPRISGKRAVRKRRPGRPAAWPRKTAGMAWGALVFWLMVWPITTIFAEQLVRGHGPPLRIIAAIWVTLVDGFIYLAAILIFRPNQRG